MEKKYETPTMESIEIKLGGIIANSCTSDSCTVNTIETNLCTTDSSGSCPLVLCGSDNICSQNVPYGR